MNKKTTEYSPMEAQCLNASTFYYSRQHDRILIEWHYIKSGGVLMEELLQRILTELSEIQRTMATKQEVAEIQRTMEETKREVAEIQRTMAAKQDVAEIIALLQSYHAENIAADEKLLEGIRTTNDRLDFQRERLIRAEEELYLLARKQ
jgi:hypothetical protein